MKSLQDLSIKSLCEGQTLAEMLARCHMDVNPECLFSSRSQVEALLCATLGQELGSKIMNTRKDLDVVELRSFCQHVNAGLGIGIASPMNAKGAFYRTPFGHDILYGTPIQDETVIFAIQNKIKFLLRPNFDYHAHRDSILQMFIREIPLNLVRHNLKLWRKRNNYEKGKYVPLEEMVTSIEVIEYSDSHNVNVKNQIKFNVQSEDEKSLFENIFKVLVDNCLKNPSEIFHVKLLDASGFHIASIRDIGVCAIVTEHLSSQREAKKVLKESHKYGRYDFEDMDDEYILNHLALGTRTMCMLDFKTGNLRPLGFVRPECGYPVILTGPRPNHESRTVVAFYNLPEDQHFQALAISRWGVFDKDEWNEYDTSKLKCVTRIVKGLWSSLDYLVPRDPEDISVGEVEKYFESPWHYIVTIRDETYKIYNLKAFKFFLYHKLYLQDEIDKEIQFSVTHSFDSKYKANIKVYVGRFLG